MPEVLRMGDWIDREILLRELYSDVNCKNTRFLNCVRLAPAVNRWIPCDKRMPEKNTEVLVTLYKPELGGYFRKIGRFLGDIWLINNLYSSSMENVVAWMPLPDAYNPEVNQNDKT